MKQIYTALDVSDKSTHVCVVDGAGAIIWRGVCAIDPDALASVLKKRCPAVVRVVLETGPLSAFLYHGLVERGLPAICVCGRHAKGVLSTRVNKSDPHDAEGLAQLARTGWFKGIPPPGGHLSGLILIADDVVMCWLMQMGSVHDRVNGHQRQWTSSSRVARGSEAGDRCGVV